MDSPSSRISEKYKIRGFASLGLQKRNIIFVPHVHHTIIWYSVLFRAVNGNGIFYASKGLEWDSSTDPSRFRRTSFRFVPFRQKCSSRSKYRRRPEFPSRLVCDDIFPRRPGIVRGNTERKKRKFSVHSRKPAGENVRNRTVHHVQPGPVLEESRIFSVTV